MAKTQIEFVKRLNEGVKVVLFDLLDDDGVKYLAHVGADGSIENYVAEITTNEEGKVILRLCTSIDSAIFATSGDDDHIETTIE